MSYQPYRTERTTEGWNNDPNRFQNLGQTDHREGVGRPGQQQDPYLGEPQNGASYPLLRRP